MTPMPLMFQRIMHTISRFVNYDLDATRAMMFAGIVAATPAFSQATCQDAVQPDHGSGVGTPMSFEMHL
jgi:hypothetical protein